MSLVILDIMSLNISIHSCVHSFVIHFLIDLTCLYPIFLIFCHPFGPSFSCNLNTPVLLSSSMSSCPAIFSYPHNLHLAHHLTFWTFSFLFSTHSSLFSSQTFHPVIPDLFFSSPLLFSWSPSFVFFESTTSLLCHCLISSMHCIPAAHPPLLHPLSGCCPPCQPLWQCPLVQHLPPWWHCVRESLWQLCICTLVCLWALV